MSTTNPAAGSGEAVTKVDDFDGDGFVIRADVVIYPISGTPIVRLTFNSGNHDTTVELCPEDLGHMVWLMERAQKAVVKALVAK